MIIASVRDLDPAAILAIADGEPVELAPALLDSVAAGRAAMLAALSASSAPVYGVNTGMGNHSSHRLSGPEQEQHQRRLLAGRAVGGPPWLSAREVRALFSVRLRDFLAAETAASPQAVRFLADRLGDGFIPCVPRGGLGSAGEILALSHAFGAFVGYGSVLSGEQEEPASAALSKRGVEPYQLGAKEGLSFLQGSPMATAHAIIRGEQARVAIGHQLEAAAISIEAIGAPRALYTPALAGQDCVLGKVFTTLAALTDGGYTGDAVQAPVSFRVVPQAIAHAERVRTELHATVVRTLDTPSDSPAFLEGRFVSTAGFHAVALGLRMDALTAALVHLGELSTQRMHRLLDPQRTGLPSQLTPDPGPNAGLSPLHKRAVGELHTLRRLATPATLGSIDTSSGQEDAQAFVPAAGEQLRSACACLTAITACELIAAHHAHRLRGTPTPDPLRHLHQLIAGTVPFTGADRPLSAELRTLITILDEELPLVSKDSVQ